MIPSPCNNRCLLQADDVCRGCLRTASEIIGWGYFSDHQKQRVLDRIKMARPLDHDDDPRPEDNGEA